MATASVTNSNFVNGTAADADQVDQNFADLVAFLNASVVHLDGSKTLTGLLNLHTADPTAATHAVSKDWLDGPYLNARTGVNQTYVDSVQQVVKFAAPEVDTDSGYSTGTGLYTAPRAGIYQVSWCGLTLADSIQIWGMEVQAAGVSYLGPRVRPSEVAPGVDPHMTMSVAVKLTAGQTVAPRASISTGTSKIVGEWMTIVWLHG